MEGIMRQRLYFKLICVLLIMLWLSGCAATKSGGIVESVVAPTDPGVFDAKSTNQSSR